MLLPPDSVGTGLQIPHLEELLTALTDCYRASQSAEDLKNHLPASWLEEPPDNAGCQMTELAEKLPIALQSRGQTASEKDMLQQTDMP